jgi:hypothetical protein
MYKELPYWVIVPYFVDSVLPVLYIGTFMIVGKMKMPYLGNIWVYYLIFQIAKSTDFFLTMRMTPYRDGAILGVMFIQMIYVVWASINANKH